MNMVVDYSILAGLAAGTTEAVVVVTPMEVVKIRLQSQQHSLADPLETPKYRNAGHAVYTIVREEGFGALYRGVSLTALRQATNQGNVTLPSHILNKSMLKSNLVARCKLHSIPRDQKTGTQIPTFPLRAPLLPTHDNWPNLRRNGTLLQRSNRHHKNPSPKISSRTRPISLPANRSHSARNVETGGFQGVL